MKRARIVGLNPPASDPDINAHGQAIPMDLELLPLKLKHDKIWLNGNNYDSRLFRETGWQLCPTEKLSVLCVSVAKSVS